MVGFPLIFDSAGFATMPLVPIDWKSLKGALDRIISFTEAKDWKICMFIDGLDEYRNMERVADYTEEELDIITHGDKADASWGTNTLTSDNHREILEFLLNLARTSSGLKLCLSSRELAAFKEALSRFPRLRVHKHTREDIAAYALTSFSDCAVASPARRKALANDIAQRSSGVFLWVRLVVDHIIALYSNKGEQADLHKALGLFPRQLGGQNGLYMKMLSLVAEKDRLDGRRVIQLLLTAEAPFSGIVITYALRCTKTTGEINIKMVVDTPIRPEGEMDRRGIKPKDWEDSRKWFQKRLRECTGGLLECEAPLYQVTFIHKTAKEFILHRST